MDLSEALAGRRSCRSYLTDPVAPDVLDPVLAACRRAPSVGNTWALDLVVLERRADVDRYWDTTLPAGPRRDRFGWPGLLRAPVIVLPVVDTEAYVRRYAEDDKARTGLGAGADAWSVPYWWVDGGAAVMAMLLAATSAGLGSLLFGVFGNESDVATTFGIPGDRRILGAVALGWPDGDDRPSASAGRRRPTPREFIRRGGW
ncbi:MAG: nitroreductase family protein [Microthrixaceae bacterium]